MREVSLLGESFVLHEPDRPAWRWVLDAYLAAFTIYIVFALVRYGMRDLVVSGEPVGRLVMWQRNSEALSGDQRELVELSRQYLAVSLHRLGLAASLVTSAVDEERHRIARDLHDSVSQQLYAAAFTADALAASLDGEDRAASAERIRSLLVAAQAEMRALLFELQPQEFDNSSITNLVVNLCDSMSTSWSCEVRAAVVTGPRVPVKPKLAIYRIAQEAVSNAL